MKRFDVTKPAKIDLTEFSPEPPKGADKSKSKKRLEELGTELSGLQDLMWGAKTHSLLVVLQGRDASGKDGAIRNVAGFLNPRGVHVTSFGVPTPEELGHDFLWRVHAVTPKKGEVALWNRSHYEDVLVVRVHELAPKDVIERRYGQIREFEELLTESGTIVRKFFLEIDRDEQEERLLDREKDPAKSWKVSATDWKERARWDDFTKAYEEALGRTGSETAPWTLVPANSKWWRDVVVAETLVEALRPHRAGWMARLEEISKGAKRDLAEMRKGTRTRKK